MTSEPLVKRDFRSHKDTPRPLILGVDPGFSGAVCVVDIRDLSIVDMIDIPTFKTETRARKQGFLTQIDSHKLSQELDFYSKFVACAFLEEPGAMPKQGLSSTFRFGHTCGVIEGVLAGHYVAGMPVKPAAWKLALGLTHEKDKSLRMAGSVYPNYTWLWKLKKHNDRAEAALLAYYGLKYFSKFVKLNA